MKLQFSNNHSLSLHCQLLVGLLLLAFTGCGIAPEKPFIDVDADKPADLTIFPELDPGSYMSNWEMPDGQIVSFSISIPQTYTNDTPVPVILSLHFGADRITRHFGNRMLQSMVKPATLELDPIIVAPDVFKKSWVNIRCEERVMALMNEVCKTYNVDRSRIAVVGYSLGAEGAWHFAGKHPDFFTAAVPIAGHPPKDYMKTRWTVPTLAVNSRSDEVFPFKFVDDAIRQLQARNDQVQLFALDDISHYESGKFVEPLKEAATWVQQVWDANQNQ